MTAAKMKKVNIREVAKVAGMSIASVSRALHHQHSPYLSEGQRAHILKVCDELQYYPNEHARRMLSRRANTVAIFFPSFGIPENSFGSHMLDANFGSCMLGIQSVLAENAIQLMLCEASEKFLAGKQHLKMIRGKMIDGILSWGITNNDEYVQDLLNEGTPLVMVQNEKSDCNCVKIIADDYLGMKSVLKRVFDCGHRKIAILNPLESSSTGCERKRGIDDALAEYGIKPVFITGGRGYGYEFGRQSAMEIFDNCPDATCIIASNDMAAWGCIEVAMQRKLHIPEDISITGADGLKEPGDVIVSSFFSPSYEIGRQGAECLLKLIAGEKNTGRIRLPTIPIIGNTLGVNHGK